ncbi:flavin reductase [Pseudonocardia sp. CNS-139]|nr:flavin reductase [Pseudonocardia sp. CNS-139]
MSAVCSPVSVVTTCVRGQPFGTTVSAFASLSMDPPMVLVALDNRSDLLAAVGETRTFGLNVLSHDQAHLAVAFARKGGPAKFDGVAWSPDGDVPRLLGTTGFLSCRVADVVPGGDHVVVLGTVRTADTRPGPPLTYHARAFGTHLAHPVG